jgi:G8 domain
VTIGETIVYSSDKLWSDPKTWPDWKIPKEGDDIVIGTNESIVFDMEQTPIYGYIQINGRVIFK